MIGQENRKGDKGAEADKIEKAQQPQLFILVDAFYLLHQRDMELRFLPVPDEEVRKSEDGQQNQVNLDC
ncbi:hypothetical protein D3C87_2148630 [compost metagenome]